MAGLFFCEIIYLTLRDYKMKGLISITILEIFWFSAACWFFFSAENFDPSAGFSCLVLLRLENFMNKKTT